ncbi:L-fucose permease OS=Haemophilus influenzae (strain ATCC 51907 / DSM 11121 / KW20 / Rd) GN=fucP PE=3 SV=1 [Rhizoctonia solani AG-1 IB]|uniref:L-fucose permease n=1 Tax=Thanatephorus cucumeris (strain AG1-IB / isolate 7/3/14) TaxID=1108050 RepID=A0A0B7F7V5_THACB|nr:L-fucose permease OS=Haemophilus influenzae (strain ATCC 51907 / DSM 11121 / KW20 / Rd) GN=fucP PE=3 SV=1 [Rhizoctonia solani AG-1 IB]
MAGGAAVMPSKGMSWRQMLPPRNIAYPFALVTSLFFLWGFTYGLLDVLNKHFQNTLGVTKLESTGLQIAYFGAGYFAFSPIAGEVFRRRGYKFTIIMGLALYSLGAIFFWPCAKFAGESNKKAVFGGFVVCTAVIGWGLAALEIAALPYIMYPPGAHPAGAAFRLQFSMGFNGIGIFAGPFIASKYFFSDANRDNLTNVQWVYLAVALMGVFVAFLFVITKLPVTSEAELEEQVQAAAEMSGTSATTDQPFYKQYRVFFGWFAQFLGVSSQVTVASFFINYGAEVVGWADAKTSKFLSYALIMFTIGRFIGMAILSVWPAELLVGIWSIACFVLITCATFLSGKAGLGCLMAAMFFQAPLFPCIFAISTKGMGRHTSRASSLLISAIGGNAVLPPIQGAIADAHGTHISYAIAMPAYVYIASFALFLWFRHGAHFNVHEEGAAKVGSGLEAAERKELGLQRTYTSDSKRLSEKDATVFEDKEKI